MLIFGITSCLGAIESGSAHPSTKPPLSSTLSNKNRMDSTGSLDSDFRRIVLLAPVLNSCTHPADRGHVVAIDFDVPLRRELDTQLLFKETVIAVERYIGQVV